MFRQLGQSLTGRPETKKASGLLAPLLGKLLKR
jgi:hypothetical protein